MRTLPAAFDLDPDTGLPDPFAGGQDAGDAAALDTFVDTSGAPAPTDPSMGGLTQEQIDAISAAPSTGDGVVNPEEQPGAVAASGGVAPQVLPWDSSTATGQALNVAQGDYNQMITPAIRGAGQAMMNAFNLPAITANGGSVMMNNQTGDLVYTVNGVPQYAVATLGPDGTYSGFTPQGIALMNQANVADPGGAGALASINTALKGVNDLLSSPAGRLLGAGAIGALGLGAQALFGRQVQRATAAQAPNTATVNQLLATGQGQTLAGMLAAGASPNQGLTGAINQGLQGQSNLATLANIQAQQQIAAQQQEQPVAQGIAMNALGQIPGLMNATTNPNIVGTGQVGQLANTQARSLIPQGGNIGAGIGQQIQNVLSGNYSNPILENRVKLQQQEFQDRMAAQLGPDWANTTTGMQQKEQEDLLENSLRFQDQQQTIANYTPLFNQATALQAGTGAQATGQVQQAQAQGIGQAAQLSQLGQQNVPSITNTLASVAPTTPLSGVASASQAAQQNLVNQQQTGIINAGATNQANQSLASGIGSVTGVLAGSVARPPGTNQSLAG